MTSYTNCDVGLVCWETSAKQLSIDVYGSGDLKQIKVYNEWQTLPKVRSYDVIALRYNISNSNAYRTSYTGVQVSDVGNAYYTESENANVNTADNGVGISMNLYDDATSKITNTLTVPFKVTGNVTLDLYATYQHATSSVTLANSKSYTFGSSGLGKVLVFNSSSIQSKYDGMQGVNVQLAIVA